MTARLKALVMLLLGLLASACGKDTKPTPSTPSTASADEVPFVVFMEPSAVIDRVGATVRVPAAVGSTVSPRTLASSDPGIVEVTADGGLRGRSVGRTTIRATGNPAQVLEVEVREQTSTTKVATPASAPAAEASTLGQLSLSPTSADLQLGQVIIFEAAAGGQSARPEWRFDGPVLLQQSAPTAFVATRVGKTRLCAAAAHQVVCAVVVVGR